MEVDINGLYELQVRLIAKASEEGVTNEERAEIIAQLTKVSGMITNYLNTYNDESRIANEAERIATEAESKKRESVLGFIGNVVKGVAAIGAASVTAIAGSLQVKAILKGEAEDVLPISKAFNFVTRR